ncbi:hypothetical protein PGRAN_12294 [Listeria grandensis FSL F6-0971]|uniref:HD/PDEase domain-containing protein n=1 Tax=Listeria grandensis FSL F6-0971 TaxID=1265819 RepID=W7B5Z5_9LIST|nr:HD domain-containing protein [Listeria grandensis]EUJ22729.1 hypothetical protein PGRAN_12294 [Listeria grandensis FSL F6-0971]
MNNLVLEKAKEFIKQEFANEVTGHDWYHIDRVYKMATQLQSKEGGNLKIIQLAALFHDFTDKKLKEYPEEAERQMIAWLRENNLSEMEIEMISNVIKNISYSNESSHSHDLSLETKIVQDADRLDAIGAIGIARCFTYGGSEGRQIYNPENKEATSVQHFFDKLLNIKGIIQTGSAKEVADTRHCILISFLKELENECNIQF